MDYFEKMLYFSVVTIAILLIVLPGVQFQVVDATNNKIQDLQKQLATEKTKNSDLQKKLDNFEPTKPDYSLPLVILGLFIFLGLSVLGLFLIEKEKIKNERSKQEWTNKKSLKK